MERTTRVALLAGNRNSVLQMAVAQALAAGCGPGIVVRVKGTDLMTTLTEADVMAHHEQKTASKDFVGHGVPLRPNHPLRAIDDVGLDVLNKCRADRARKNAKRLRDFDRQEAGKHKGTANG